MKKKKRKSLSKETIMKIKMAKKDQYGTPEQRFWAKIDMPDLLSCWQWTAFRDNWGYGRIEIDGKICKAHRVSWILFYGEIPKGLQINHKCNNPACCNPAHLYAGTPKENSADMFRAGRQPDRFGENGGNSKLSESEVIEIIGLINSGISNAKIAKQYQVDHRTISAIKMGISWKYLSKNKELINEPKDTQSHNGNLP